MKEGKAVVGEAEIQELNEVVYNYLQIQIDGEVEKEGEGVVDKNAEKMAFQKLLRGNDAIESGGHLMQLFASIKGISFNEDDPQGQKASQANNSGRNHKIMCTQKRHSFCFFKRWL
jgi:hypothetical protein